VAGTNTAEWWGFEGKLQEKHEGERRFLESIALGCGQGGELGNGLCVTA